MMAGALDRFLFQVFTDTAYYLFQPYFGIRLGHYERRLAVFRHDRRTRFTLDALQPRDTSRRRVYLATLVLA